MEHCDPAELRRRYEGIGLDEAEAATDPVAQFRVWFDEAAGSGLPEPNAMVLTTATPDGVPRGRTVLLKAYDSAGFVFYTNLTSRKGREIAANPRACLVFPWHPIRRQVIVTGEVEELPREESAAYFRSRPYGSQIGAWASRQSAVIGSRAELDARFAELSRRWPEGTEVPLPDFWGGLRVRPYEMEFWQGRGDRLHDRLRYRRTDGDWVLERLSP
ncbi:MAG: pyridoxamine 5'-phosphate oxidase [Streptosporangiales bacterium]|nr:pyridoxamine 5'-phosphate oxidase [Streptosporangiales bacterium]